ncbi:hypothetical protein F0562_003042 [Nyssa sinensis]|uniref:SGNH hydrolase-type esterase domain-containing protein n=1 Tax=Nyssa sinensis TaxID=561372 RepID=A0A5J5BTH1_9ASTE|nr:hypothetical protein F0562_003042 [Nyssa sinensis]
MASSSSFHLCVLFVYAILVNVPTTCYGDHDHHVALFVFGDSLSDPGNNNYINTIARANFRPYGETFFKYPTGRFSDGRLITDFIAEYAKLPLIPPYKQPGNHHFINGANFASGGAGALVETNQGLVIDLKTQLRYFKHVERLLRQRLGDKDAKKLLSRAVYFFSIGSNDCMSPFLSNSSFFQSYSREEYVEMVNGNLTAVIKEIYKKGGRKFGFLNLPPWGCVPIVRALKPGNSSECWEEANALVKLHNYALSQVLQKLESQHKGFIYSISDFYTSVRERMDNPSRYGFKEGKSACCGGGLYRGISSCGGKRGIKEYQLCHNPSEYLFFDSAHPSEMANQQFAKLMWSGTPNITWPYNLKALFQI